MTVGKVVTKADVDSTMADLASNVLTLLHRQEELERWKDRTPQEQLEADGYTADEAFLILSCIDHLAEARVWLTGGVVPSETHDTASDLGKFVGMGPGAGGANG